MLFRKSAHLSAQKSAIKEGKPKKRANPNKCLFLRAQKSAQKRRTNKEKFLKKCFKKCHPKKVYTFRAQKSARKRGVNKKGPGKVL